MAAQPSPTTSAQDIQTIAVLSLSGTTVTATVPPSTSGVAVVDGTTISFRHEGITLSDGEVFSLGFDGLVASTTTASYEYVSLSASQSLRYDSTRHPTGTSVVVTDSQDVTSTLPPDTPLLPTSSTGMTSSPAASQVSTTLMTGSATASSTSSGSTTSSTGSGNGSGSMATSMTMSESSTSGAQVGAGNTNAAPLTTNGGSGAPVRASHVGFGGLFVAGLGLLVTFGAMVGL